MSSAERSDARTNNWRITIPSNRGNPFVEWRIPKQPADADWLRVRVAISRDEFERMGPKQPLGELTRDVEVTFWQCPMSRAKLRTLLDLLHAWLESGWKSPSEVVVLDVGAVFAIEIRIGASKRFLTGPGKPAFTMNIDHSSVGVSFGMLCDYSCIQTFAEQLHAYFFSN